MSNENNIQVRGNNNPGRPETHPSEKMVAAIVARGRTIFGPHPTMKKIVRTNEKGEPIYGPVQAEFGPGTEIELPESEVKRLRMAGYLLEAGQSSPVLVGGAHVIETGDTRNISTSP